jgi:hypothetical protein
VIDRVTTLALKSGVPRELIFANRNRIPFSWSTSDDNSTAHADLTPVAPYPDIPAEMPGVLLQRHLRTPPASVTPFCQPDPDWTQLADEAAENADLDFTEALPPLPEVIAVNDEDVFQVPLVQPANALTEKQCVPVQSSDTPAPLPHHQESSRYPTRTRRPPQHLNDYVFMTVAEEHALPTERPYRTAGGTTVDLAIQDECRMAHVCHYVMTHIADSFTTLMQSNQNKNKNSMA